MKEVYLLFPMHPYSRYFSVHGVWQSFPILGLFAWISPRLRRSSSGSWLRFGVFLYSLGFGFGLFCTTGSFRRPPESRFSFSEDVPLVVQLSRDSRRLGDVSACGTSVVISSSESYWPLLVSGLLQPGNELQALSLGSLFLS